MSCLQAFGQALKLPIGKNTVMRQRLAHNYFPRRIESLTVRRHSNLLFYKCFMKCLARLDLATSRTVVDTYLLSYKGCDTDWMFDYHVNWCSSMIRNSVLLGTLNQSWGRIEELTLVSILLHTKPSLTSSHPLICFKSIMIESLPIRFHFSGRF